jgi:hypothetical protein
MHLLGGYCSDGFCTGWWTDSYLRSTRLSLKLKQFEPHLAV